MAVAMMPSPSFESEQTPLRMLAHSVAEAALKPDPSSPSFGSSLPPCPSFVHGWGRQIVDLTPCALDALPRSPRSTRTDCQLRPEAAPFRAHQRTRSDHAAVPQPRPSQLLRAQATSRSANTTPVASPTKTTHDLTRLPSLAQIQARVSTRHKRGSSVDAVTPLEAMARPATPPSPTRESRLPSFLRKRTTSAGKPRPISMPPLPQQHVQVYIIPPTLRSPTSPTGSLSSMTSSSSSSTYSSRRVPMITCTHAESPEADQVLVVPTLDYLGTDSELDTHTDSDYFMIETKREEKAREMKMRLGRALRARA